MDKVIKILIVVDEMVIAANISLQLSELGYEVIGILPQGEEALSHIQIDKPDIVLLDIKLKGEMDGIETAREIQKHYNIPIIYLTANADEVHFSRAKETHPYAFISQPFKKLHLQRAIELTVEGVVDEIRASVTETKNGTIYNHHENINIVRKVMYAFENKDCDKAYSFYDENARFMDPNSPTFEAISLSEQKEADKNILEKFEITSIDMVGYPDYLHYKLGDARVVQSWWNINLIRKLDKKAIILPIHYIMDFNKEGKITSETAYYDSKLLE